MNLTEPQAGSDLGGAQNQGRASAGWNLQALRLQDLHHLWRARYDRQYRPFRAGALARCAEGNARHLAFSRAEVSCQCRWHAWRAQRCRIAPRWSTSSASMPRPPARWFMAIMAARLGFLIGEENKGLACMFTMMNSARLNVGVQGVAIAERAFQQALAYAKDRRQGHVAGDRSETMSPIVLHPDVARMLMTMKAMTAAARAICLMTAESIDRSRREKDEAARERALARASLLTPVAKAFSTDIGNEVASLGIQVHGGMGYIEETGAAQFLRDARIAAIYEGTNGIQAIDLVQRKLGLSEGDMVRREIADMRASLAAAGEMQRRKLWRYGTMLDGRRGLFGTRHAFPAGGIQDASQGCARWRDALFAAFCARARRHGAGQRRACRAAALGCGETAIRHWQRGSRRRGFLPRLSPRARAVSNRRVTRGAGVGPCGQPPRWTTDAIANPKRQDRARRRGPLRDFRPSGKKECADRRDVCGGDGGFAASRPRSFDRCRRVCRGWRHVHGGQ